MTGKVTDLRATILMVTLLLIVQSEVISAFNRKSHFHKSASSCPSSCACDSVFGKKRVLCNEGGMTEIPTDKMDKETQIIIFSGTDDRSNHVTIGRIFMEFPQLEVVTITHSGLPAIGDSSFWPGRELIQLDLSHNRIRIIRDMDFNGLANLKSLNLSDNALSETPSAPFRFLTNLTQLSLARNKLSNLVPRMFYKLDKLVHLDLSSNSLSNVQLSAEMFKDIRLLRVLKMDHCQIKSISTDVYKELPNLKELQLSDNKLSFVSSFEFTSLANLKSLYLDGNEITTIRDNAFYGLRLVHLGLSRNSLDTLPSFAFAKLELQSLDISSNKFLAFQSDLLNPVRLSLGSLNCNGNKDLDRPSESVKRLLSPLTNVQLVKLSGMNIEPCLSDDLFANMSKVVLLDLSHNRLANLSADLLRPLVNLETLDLSYNGFKTLTTELLDTVDTISSLKAIYLQGNPWSCYQCHVTPLINWINTKSPSSPYFNVCKTNGKTSGQACIKCSSPEYLSSKNLHLVSQVELEQCADPSVQLRLTASQPRMGFVLVVLAMVTVVLFILSLVVMFRYRQGAVYYTREEERYDHAAIAIEKMPKKEVGCFSITSSGRPLVAHKFTGKHLPFSHRKASATSCTSTVPLNNGAQRSPPSPGNLRTLRRIRF
ncbi:Insulin-like growth factor-binding protein complex acid labile subunit [Halotydeus destructor]|nr:Insulin-like growth factor-binding protein complex acid labile subunit [Halotydeus destructor]